jgi:hypothetical protein
MKNIVLIAIAFLTLNVTAQRPDGEHRKHDRKERRDKFKDFTAEEIATLHTKKMTLDLDLSEAQQNKIYKLNFETAKDRKAKMQAREAQKKEGKKQELSKDERYKLANERLDKQIAHKKALKDILSKEQFEKWEHTKKNRAKKKKAMKRRKHKKEKR